MDYHTPALARARRQLEEQGRFPGGVLPPDIADSWLRSLDRGLDPLGQAESLVVEAPDLERERARHADLIRFARPELELLYDQIAGSNFMIALGSPEGLVLDTLADADFEGSDASRDVRPGSLWDEVLRGTNAMGLTVATGRPAQVYGGEHFFHAHGDIACLSAPIFDGRGALAGLLDASSGSTVRQQHTAALVQMSAANIENGLIRYAHDGRLVLQFHPRPEYLGTLSAGLLVLDEGLGIHAVNRRGAQFLTGFQGLLGRAFSEVFDGRFEEVAARLVRGETLRLRDRFGSAVSMRCVANRASFALAGRHVPSSARDGSRPGPDRNLFKDVVVEDPSLWRQLMALPDAARRGLPIAIEGETGTGKEIVARLAHAAGGRERPFVVFDARLATEDNFARLMFGDEASDPGLLARASGGTLYLDEVAGLPPRAQAVLARLLDTGEYRRPSSSEVMRADIRVVASSSRPLDDLLREGVLSAELRFRLAGYPVSLPPLRARSDLAALARKLFAAADASATLADDAVAVIEAHDWPGNIHELRARMELAALQAAGRVVRRADLADLLRPEPEEDAPVCEGCRGVPWKEHQCRAVRAEVSASGGKIAEAARRLGMSRTTVYKHLQPGPQASSPNA